jgi:hypothetical protein
MFYIGLFLSLVVGVILGLVGGGGSILTIPLVEHFYGISTYEATTYSLFIVTISSLFGVVQRIGKELITYKIGLLFLIPSTLIAFSIRLLSIPETFSIFDQLINRDFFISILLAIVMLFVAIRMLQRKEDSDNNREKAVTFGRILFMGTITGFLSGLLGAGGGFIIVPILMSIGLPIKKAVATSMFIIVIQSTFALFGDFLHYNNLVSGFSIDYELVTFLSTLMVIGVYIGTKLQNSFSGKILRRLFAGILVLVAVGILIDQLTT